MAYCVVSILHVPHCMSHTACSTLHIPHCMQRIGTALELYDKMRSFDLRPSYEAVSRLMEELLQWGDLHGAESMRK